VPDYILTVSLSLEVSVKKIDPRSFISVPRAPWIRYSMNIKGDEEEKLRRCICCLVGMVA
jgi:hypothetical protein